MNCRRGAALLLLAGLLAAPAFAAAQSQSPPVDEPPPAQDSDEQVPPRDLAMPPAGPPVAEPNAQPVPERKPAPAMPAAPAASPAPLPAQPLVCEITLDAPKFLREAGRRGIFPEEISSQACEINAPDNQFFAGAQKPCKVLFANSEWLATGGRFANLRGAGTFSVAPPTSRGIVVTIPPQGGVAFDKVILKVQVRTATCPSLQAADVLAN